MADKQTMTEAEQREGIAAGRGPIIGLFESSALTNLTGPFSDELRREVWQRTLWPVGWPMLVFFASGLGSAIAYFFSQRQGIPSDSLIELAFSAILHGALAVISLALLLVPLITVSRDLAAGEVRQSDGAIVLRRNGLATEFGGQRRWASNPIVLSEPGPYRFHYLPRSGIILALQPLSLETWKALHTETQSISDDDAQDEAEDTTTTRLGPVLKFAETDLAQNRSGQLSTAQARRLLGQLVVRVVVWPLLALFGYFAIFGRSQFSLLIGLTVLGPLALLMAVSPVRRALNLWHDWRAGRVERVEGVVTTHMLRDPQAPSAQQTYFYAVAHRTFEVPLLASELLDNAKYYRVYYAPRSKQVLALERKRRPAA